MRRKLFKLAVASFYLMAVFGGHAGAADPNIIVNGSRLGNQQIQMLRNILGVPADAAIPAGDYWYDNVSGLWGKRGGPTLGQIVPGLKLGGPLSTDASNGDTGVFINGREIHRQELTYLQSLFGAVNLGRYWLNGWGIGGYEGGPPLFNLRTAGASAGGGYTRRTPFGSLGGDSNCSYYLHPGGSSVLNCK
jgi:hypothetical protein